ncbi:major facilitator superfamily transporter [Rhizoctonia solani]|uniref:Major facilitator superfamily transporter n=1 Tax=Rhizoctonia solani TaxID=456999 RepID=A0A8H8T2E2_9AGAM|nr:major facilitator superfamily transporter [Rhizoctonia solani]QRW25468.1 major facilitator superfamily transporter [Rhizoctonia solani]
MSLATPRSETGTHDRIVITPSTTQHSHLVDEPPRDLAERHLIRKLDMLIMPITYLLYILAYLDRSNLGNAKLQGLDVSLFPNDVSGNQFALLSAMFYIAFLSWQIPLTLAAKRFPPNLVIGIVAVAWGISSSLQAATFNYAGITTTRYFLGYLKLDSSAPVVPFYYTLFYLKSEHGFRTSLYVSGAPLASAFGGLIAYGVQNIRSIATWRILFLIEGLPTILVGLLASASTRLAREVVSEGNRINWQHVVELDRLQGMAALPSRHISIFAFHYQVFGLYGCKGTDDDSTPYACACIVMVLVAKASDHFKTRGPFAAASLALSGIGYTILLAVPTMAIKVRYAAIVLAVTGTYSGFPVSTHIMDDG